MADQHIGYSGTVDAAQLAVWLPSVSAGQYSVGGPNDAKVVANAVGDRGVTVKKGTVTGDGVMDVFEADKFLNFTSVASGADRWDMIVLRRTWNATPGSSTSVYTIIVGGTNKTLPARNTNKGVLADQPIALCRIKAGSSVVQEIVDLRVWAHNGGMYGKDALVQSYLTEPGTHLTIGSNSWVRRVTHGTSSDTTGWILAGDMQQSIKLFGGSSGSLYGSGSPQTKVNNGDLFLVQAGTTVNTSDSQGYSRLTFQKPFPRGLITVMGFNGDDWATGGSIVFASAGNSGGNVPGWHGTSGYGNNVDWVYAVLGQPGTNNGGSSLSMSRIPNKLHRINWIAIGY